MCRHPCIILKGNFMPWTIHFIPMMSAISIIAGYFTSYSSAQGNKESNRTWKSRGFSLSFRSEGTRKRTWVLHVPGAAQLAEVWRNAFQVTHQLFSNQCEGNCGSSGTPNTNQHVSMTWKSVSELIAGCWWKDYFLYGGKENKNPAWQLYAKMTLFKFNNLFLFGSLLDWMNLTSGKKKKKANNKRKQTSKTNKRKTNKKTSNQPKPTNL